LDINAIHQITVLHITVVLLRLKCKVQAAKQVHSSILQSETNGMLLHRAYI